jgi:heptosyltransferase I
MGDLMHALPALTDASSMYPGIEFDWVVDESFAEVPSWHPAVKNIYKSAHRRWRNNFSDSLKKNEFSNFYHALNENKYDAIIDAQNNVKSSIISLLRRGQVDGMDRHSVAEQPAFLAYKNRHFISKNQHAIERQRELFALALDYEKPGNIADYGIKKNAFIKPDIKIEKPYLLLVHNASWTTKLWPEEYWHDFIELVKTEGLSVVLPGGNQEELERAQRIASKHSNAQALPKLSLSELGGLIENAEGAMCCDTGLAHLTAMVGTPSVTLYGPTSVGLIGTSGNNQFHLNAENPAYSCSPCYKRVCNFEGGNSDMSACMNSFTPESAWNLLREKIKT